MSTLFNWLRPALASESRNYETDKLELLRVSQENPGVYETATFMHPRGMLVTKRDISPSGWAKLGMGRKYQEFNAFGSGQGGAGRPIPYLEQTLVRATSLFSWMRDPLQVPDIIADLAGGDTTWAQVVSDDEATWYRNRVYDLVGVPIFLGVSANITGPGSTATEGLPTAAGPSAYVSLGRAARTPSYNNAQKVQGIARKYVRGELSSRDNAEIEKNIDSLIAEVDLAVVDSKYSKTIKHLLETLKKTMTKSRNEATAVQKQKRKNKFETRRQNRADQIGQYSVEIASSKAGAQTAKASRADEIGRLSVAVAESKADATLANEKARSLLAALMMYREIDDPEKVEETKLELAQLIGRLNDAKIAVAIGDALKPEDADVEDAPDTPEIEAYLPFLLECVGWDRTAAGGGMDTAAGPPGPTALAIAVDEAGIAHPLYFTLTGGATLEPMVWTGPTPEGTTIVLLGLVGQYTTDVAARELEQTGEPGGLGYWFPEETAKIAAAPANRYRVFTKTTAPRIKKWIERKNLARDRSGMVPLRTTAPTQPAPTSITAKMAEMLDNVDLIPASSEVYVGSY